MNEDVNEIYLKVFFERLSDLMSFCLLFNVSERGLNIIIIILYVWCGDCLTRL